MIFLCFWGTRWYSLYVVSIHLGLSLLSWMVSSLTCIPKVSHGEAIIKITTNGYKLQVITSRGTHGDTYSLTPFEQTCYMPLILKFPVNVDLMVTCNVRGPAINFAKVTHQSFGPLHNLLYYLTQGQFYYNLGGIWYPACQSFP